MENKIETEQDLERLLGQYESIRLDFKASALLAQPTDRIVKQLAEDVSAFANTEGGVIVIGIKEGKQGKKCVAVEIDKGIDPVQVSPERLEQLIASNVSPPIPGLTVRPVPLSGPKSGRFVYVVTVPKGTTAYQSKCTLRYYGRSEFAADPLHDHVIRLLMTRGRVAQAALSLLNCTVLRTSEDKLAQWKKEKAKWDDEHRDLRDEEMIMEYFKSGLREPRLTSEYSFQTSLKNTGEATIDDFLLSVSFKFGDELTVEKPGGSIVVSGTEEKFRMPGEKRTERYSYPKIRIFPGDQLVFPGGTWRIEVPHGKSLKDSNLMIRWAVYLEDSPPSSGELNVGAELSRLIAVRESSSEKTRA
ncbi:MAG: helix-turn-helix domain-containing protein [Candidatus Binatia bacterium]